MDEVHIAHDDGGLLGEFSLREPGQKSRPQKPAMNIAHAGMDELAKLELLGALADLDRADFTRPFVDILEQMPMDGLEMRQIESASGYALPAALNGQPPFYAIKQRGIGNPATIF